MAEMDDLKPNENQVAAPGVVCDTLRPVQALHCVGELSQVEMKI